MKGEARNFLTLTPYVSNLIIPRIKAVPSNIAFEIALFPHNVPLPTPKSSARIIGGVIHAIHALILATRDSEEAWDKLSDNRQTSWFDWVRSPFFQRGLRLIVGSDDTNHAATRPVFHIQRIQHVYTNKNVQVPQKIGPSSLTSRAVRCHQSGP